MHLLNQHWARNLTKPFLRAAQIEDLESIAGLLTAVFGYDGIPIVQTAVELEEEFVAPSCTIENDVKVVELDGKLIGVTYTYFLPSESKEERCYIFGGVLPEFRQQGVGTKLMTWAIQHGETLLRGTGRTLPKYLRTNVSQQNESAARLFAKFGMKPVRFEEDLIREITNLPEVNVNQKYSIIPWDSDRNEEARIVKNLAFQDHWGSTPSSSEHWLQMVNGSTARLDHSFLAVNQQQEIVGLLLTHRYESDDDLLGKRIGWIDKLATLAEHRKQSIAKNLIARALHSYAEDGLTHAALSVDTQNPTGAYGLYASLGFELYRGTVTFERQVDPVGEST
jgi:ribosomal protein S18 acetylase RimI-like enzyme